MNNNSKKVPSHQTLDIIKLSSSNYIFKVITATLTLQNKNPSGSGTLDNALCNLSHYTCSTTALQDKLQKAAFNMQTLRSILTYSRSVCIVHSTCNFSALILLFLYSDVTCTCCFLRDSEISGDDATKGTLVVLPNCKPWGAGYDYGIMNKSLSYPPNVVRKSIPSFAKSSCLGLIRLIIYKIQLFNYLKMYLQEMYRLLDTLPRFFAYFLLVHFEVFECPYLVQYRPCTLTHTWTSSV